MNLSIRAKLTLSFTILFGLIVAALAIGSYVVVKQDLYSKLDLSLQVAVDTTAMAAQHEMSEHPDQAGGDDDIRQVLDDEIHVTLPDTQILVKEGGREVAYRPGGQSSSDLRHLRLQGLASQTTVEGMRIVTRRLTIPKFQTAYQIYSGRSTEATQAQLRSFRRMLVLPIPLGLALAALAGYLLARKLLAPLEELSETMAGVQSSELSARVHLKNRADEISKLGLCFNSLLDRLEGAFAFQRRFMADASHELRTPVTVALTATQATIHDETRTQQDCEDALTIVGEQMLRLKRIVTDMLFLSQADSCSSPMLFHDVYLDDAVADAVRAARPLARAKQQSLQLNALPEARCSGDHELLERAVLVLLDNSIKFTPEGGSIAVRIERSDSHWVCTVTDSGIGVPEEIQSRIFERFFRGDQKSGLKIPGAGLGLAIAKTIVEMHRGRLRLASSQEGCTRFELALPVAVGDKETSAEAQARYLAVKM